MIMARRGAENNKFTFTWIIENFHFDRHIRNLESPLFNVRTSKITSWYLSLEIYSNSIIEFFLNKKEAEDDLGNIGYQLEIIDNNRKTLYSTACDRCSFMVNFKHNEIYSKISEKVENIINNTTTIRCIMILPEAITDLVYACKVRTKIEAQMSSFKWDMKNFATVDEVSKAFFYSPSTQIKLTLSKTETFVSFVIEEMKDDEDIFIVCKIALLDANGIVIDSRRSEYFFYEVDSKIWKPPNFIKSSDLFSASGTYFDYNNFSLICEFFIFNGATLEEVHYCYDDNSIAAENNTTIDSFVNLHEDFRRMYIEHLQTDVKIHVGKQILQAHKCVLSARSPVFAAMFGKDMLEIRTDVVAIPDTETKIVDLLLRFLYDGTVDNLNNESARKLLIAANKFKVTALKEICSAFLMSNLNNENACDVLIVADKLSHEVLRNSALNYIVEHADVILTTEMWFHFFRSNFELATDVMKKLSNLYASIKNIK